jgi:hypothetical protein
MGIGACNRTCGPGPRPSASGDGPGSRRAGSGPADGDSAPDPRFLRQGFVEAVSIAAPGRAVAAARAFAAGNGYLPGQIVDHIV